jgi:hypothetical protein
MMLSARRCLRSYFNPSMSRRVKSISRVLLWSSLTRKRRTEMYYGFYSMNDNSTCLSGSKLAKIRYLRNLESKGYLLLFCLGFSSSQEQRISGDTCDKNIKYHWSRSLFNIPNGHKFETPITGLSVFVDHL